MIASGIILSELRTNAHLTKEKIMTNKITGVDGPITGWLDGHTYLIGLMAYPIRHSMSPTMHNNALDMRCSNVSMPNKKEVIKYLDKLSPASKMCDAVNTIVNDNGVLTGYTTDGIGFVQALKDEGIEIRIKL